MDSNVKEKYTSVIFSRTQSTDIHVVACLDMHSSCLLHHSTYMYTSVNTQPKFNFLMMSFVLTTWVVFESSKCFFVSSDGVNMHAQRVMGTSKMMPDVFQPWRCLVQPLPSGSLLLEIIFIWELMDFQFGCGLTD